MKGKLIVIEGTDCSGKETQARLLVEKLNKKNLNTKHLSFIMLCISILQLLYTKIAHLKGYITQN